MSDSNHQDVYAYMAPHDSGDGTWKVMARPFLTKDGNPFPFGPMGSPDDRFRPVAERSPKRFSEDAARIAVRNFEAEMRVQERAA